MTITGVNIIGKELTTNATNEVHQVSASAIGVTKMSQQKGQVTVQIPLEVLLNILDQLPEDALKVVKQRLDERLQTSLPPIVNDPAGEFWRSELGIHILQEADGSISTEEVRCILGRLSGSLAQDILREREER